MNSVTFFWIILWCHLHSSRLREKEVGINDLVSVLETRRFSSAPALRARGPPSPGPDSGLASVCQLNGDTLARPQPGSWGRVPCHWGLLLQKLLHLSPRPGVSMGDVWAADRPLAGKPSGAGGISWWPVALYSAAWCWAMCQGLSAHGCSLLGWSHGSGSLFPSLG